VQWKS